jgi:hypothetical protein
MNVIRNGARPIGGKATDVRRRVPIMQALNGAAAKDGSATVASPIERGSG